MQGQHLHHSAPRPNLLTLWGCYAIFPWQRTWDMRLGFGVANSGLFCLWSLFLPPSSRDWQGIAVTSARQLEFQGAVSLKAPRGHLEGCFPKDLPSHTVPVHPRQAGHRFRDTQLGAHSPQLCGPRVQRVLASDRITGQVFNNLSFAFIVVWFCLQN